MLWGKCSPAPFLLFSCRSSAECLSGFTHRAVVEYLVHGTRYITLAGSLAVPSPYPDLRKSCVWLESFHQQLVSYKILPPAPCLANGLGLTWLQQYTQQHCGSTGREQRNETESRVKCKFQRHALARAPFISPSSEEFAAAVRVP